MYDIVIKNCIAIDPLKGKFIGDVGIYKGKIAFIGRIKGGKNIIDAKGKYLFPGFIDNHSHADISGVYEGKNHPSLKQGITTSIIGNCGLGIYPYAGEEFFEIWSSVFGNYPVEKFKKREDYFNFLSKSKLKLLPLLPYNTVRYSFFKNRPHLKKDDKKKLLYFIEREIEHFYGLSIGLGYAPGIFLNKTEIEEIFRIVKRKNKSISVHIRNEGKSLISSLKEVIDVAKRTDVSLIISHFKSYGKRNWYKMDRAIEILENASRYINICFDVYPYTSGSTSLFSFLPVKIQILGRKKAISFLKNKNIKIKEPYVGWDSLKIIGHPEYQFLSISEIAKLKRKSESEVFIEILIDTDGRAGVIIEAMSEENLLKLLKHPLSRLGSDSLFGRPYHIRTEEAFKKFLFYYIKKKKILSPVEAIKKLSYNQAVWFGLKKGRIEVGYDGELVIVDMEKEKICSVITSSFNKPLFPDN